MSCNKSLLTREYSTWIKGLLTVFIILGHDMVFTHPLNDYGVMCYFYIFHIQGFFILPFLYGVNAKPYTLGRVKDTFARFYWPYFVLVTALLLGRCLVAGSFSVVTPQNVARLYLFCDNISIQQMCGVQIFWFLPSMMVMVLLKELYYRSGRVLRLLLLSLSVAAVSASVYAHTSYPAYRVVSSIVTYMPFGMWYAVQMLAMGVALRACMETVVNKKSYKSALTLSVFGFLVCSALFVAYVARDIGHSGINVVYSVLQNTTSLLFMVMVVSALSIWSPDVSKSVFTKLGDRSLYVYLISPFVGYVAHYTCLYANVYWWWLGLLLWPVITCVAYWASLLIRGKGEKYLFPRKWCDLSQLFAIR